MVSIPLGTALIGVAVLRLIKNHSHSKTKGEMSMENTTFKIFTAVTATSIYNSLALLGAGSALAKAFNYLTLNG